MRAVRFGEYGGPEVLRIDDDVPEPHAGPRQVRVRVEAVSVNPIDWKVRSGMMKDFSSLELPAIPGSDAAGVVDEVGEGVEGVALGDRVFGNGPGATAEYAVLGDWAHVPDGVSPTDAASLPVAVETSARVLDLLGLEPGRLVVVDGAAGGVGSALVQLAVARGLQVVGTASEGNQDFLRGLGATPTTYGAGLADRVRGLVHDTVAGGIDLAGKGGVADLIVLTGDPGRVVTIADFSPAAQDVHVSSGGDAERAFYALEEVAGLIRDGRFQAVVDQVLPWTEAAAAHARSEEGHARGKTVLTVG